MRASEFVIEAPTPSVINLVNTLQDLRTRLNQIRVDSLINIVRKQPGSEMFNIDNLADIYKNNDSVKNLVKNIGNDNFGVKYVFLEPLVQSDDQAFPAGDEKTAGLTEPQRTVSTMAKRAAKNRS